MVGWLSNPPRSMSKIADVGSKSYQVGAQNPLKSVPRGLLEGSWEGLEGSWEGLWAILAPRWLQDGSKSEKVAERTPSGPPWTPQVGGQNRSKSVPRAIQKVIILFDHFLDRLLKRFGANLAPTWLPKSSQNGAKLVPKSMQVGVLI